MRIYEPLEPDSTNYPTLFDGDNSTSENFTGDTTINIGFDDTRKVSAFVVRTNPDTPITEMSIRGGSGAWDDYTPSTGENHLFHLATPITAQDVQIRMTGGGRVYNCDVLGILSDLAPNFDRSDPTDIDAYKPYKSFHRRDLPVQVQVRFFYLPDGVRNRAEIRAEWQGLRESKVKELERVFDLGFITGRDNIVVVAPWPQTIAESEDYQSEHDALQAEIDALQVDIGNARNEAEADRLSRQRQGRMIRQQDLNLHFSEGKQRAHEYYYCVWTSGFDFYDTNDQNWADGKSGAAFFEEP